jgi:hypothetical protein
MDIIAIELWRSKVILNVCKVLVFKLGIPVLIMKLRFHFAEYYVSPQSKVVTFAINLVVMVRETEMIRN